MYIQIDLIEKVDFLVRRFYPQTGNGNECLSFWVTEQEESDLRTVADKIAPLCFAGLTAQILLVAPFSSQICGETAVKDKFTNQRILTTENQVMVLTI